MVELGIFFRRVWAGFWRSSFHSADVDCESVTDVSPESCLRGATECLKRVQDFITPSSTTSSRVKLNLYQCTYLAGVLKLVVEESGSLFLLASSSEDQAECVQSLKLLYWLATEVEGLIRDHCDSEETWMQAALALTSVPVRVASLVYQLKLCREFQRNNKSLGAAWLTFIELESVRMRDLGAVQSAHVLDELTLLETLRSSSFNSKELTTILCNRLKASKDLSTAGPVEPVNLYHLFTVDGKELERSETLGKGSFTTVYKAKWFEAVEVAEKVLPLQDRPSWNIDCFGVLAQLSHPNIVTFLGYAAKEHFCSVLLELMDGDLKLLILQKFLEDESREGPFSIQVACDIMLQVAEGVHYIHEKGVVHGNLKPSSVLLKSSNGHNDNYIRVKVGNFGLPKHDGGYDFDALVTVANAADVSGSHPYWMAPEVLLGAADSNFKSDAFSFGMFCFEILTGNVPFGNNRMELIRMTVEGIRPDFPAQCPQDLKSLIMHCWDREPHIRPSFAKICEELWFIKCFLLQDMSWMSKPEEKPYQLEKALTLPESVIRDFKTEYSSLRLTRRLARGGSDSVNVYLSKWRRPDGAEEVVALKMFDPFHFQVFENEVSILAHLKHRNVVRLLCFATDWRSRSIVMERMENADLRYWMDQRRLGCRSSRGPFSDSDAIHIMLQIAKGMDYVHGENVVHRDLKSCNILVRNGNVGGQPDVKVSDFGVSMKLESRARIALDKDTLNVGTNRWMAPELLSEAANMSESTRDVDLFRCDIYSFGMVCYEIMSGKVPFHDTKDLNDIKKYSLEGKRPVLPEWTPKNLKTLIEECWHQKASRRPLFPAILKKLKQHSWI